MTLAQHNSLAMVVSAALGGKKGAAPPPRVGDPGVKELGKGAGSLEEAVAMINAGLTI